MARSIEEIVAGLPVTVEAAVTHFWSTRERQVARQLELGRTDAGARGAVTGGAQMNAFLDMLVELLVEVGVSRSEIFTKQCIDLPGFFRPTKEWDLLVVSRGHLIAAMETKSQVGPSFGNNFNNRTEEAMGSALDLWTAFREGAFNSGIRPWLGYLFVLEDCPRSMSSVRVKQSHFPIFPEFQNASYAKRYELFCRKLVRERMYDGAAYITSSRADGLLGMHSEPASDLSVELFVRSLLGHVIAFHQVD
jgi:hypothetical protein